MDCDTQMNASTPQNADKGPLSPTQHLVWSLLKQHSRCRRDFAGFDVWEVANRISEIEDRLGIVISRERCTVHNHRHRVVRYSL